MFLMSYSQIIDIYLLPILTSGVDFEREVINKLYTLSGRILKVVASQAQCYRVDSQQRLNRFLLCTMRSGGTAHAGGASGQSIGSTVSDAIVRSCLGSTATIVVSH